MRTDWIYAAMAPAPGFRNPAPVPISPDSLACNAEAFQLPKMRGMELLSIAAQAQLNYTYYSAPPMPPVPPVENLYFCNVTVTYTHPGWDDTITVLTLLPLEGRWDGRFMGNGGGGLIAGGHSSLQFSVMPGLESGFSVSTTDGGHTDRLDYTKLYDIDWALSSEGNINWPLLVDFAHLALHDMAVIGKAVTAAFYHRPASHSYFAGTSTGGRQGHMLAQRYPSDFDGILGLLPAINWASFLFANIYPGFVMDTLKTYPPPCEIDAMTRAAIAACDLLDGVEDGIISYPGKCQSDPRGLVGAPFECDGDQKIFSAEAAEVAAACWDGPRSKDGEFQWFGFGYDANLTQPLIGPASTTLDAHDGTRNTFPLFHIEISG